MGYKIFYAFVTDNVIGIFTDWDDTSKYVNGTKNVNKKFDDYYDALNFIKKHLSDEEQKAFGIYGKKMAWDKVYRKINIRRIV